MSNVKNIITDDKGVTRGELEDGTKVVQIDCAHGHTWWRKSQRGRRPEFCPEHQPVDEDATPKRDKDDDSSTWEGPTESELANIYPLLKGEDVRKVAYFDGELRKPIYKLSQDERQSMSFIEPSTHRTQEDHYRLRADRIEFLKRVEKEGSRRKAELMRQKAIAIQTAQANAVEVE